MKITRVEVARRLVRLASRIDNRPNVEFTITYRNPAGRGFAVPGATGTVLDGLQRTIKGSLAGSIFGPVVDDTPAGLDHLAPGATAAAQMGVDMANRAIRFRGQNASVGVNGLLETFGESGQPSWVGKLADGLAGEHPPLPNVAAKKRGILTRLADWLDHNDYGYPIGLLTFAGGGVALCFQAWWIAVPLIVTAFVVCWWFG